MNKFKIILMTALLISGYQALVAMDQTAHRAQKSKKHIKAKSKKHGYALTQHIKSRMAERGITKNDILCAIAEGKQQHAKNNSRKNQVSKFLYNTEKGILIVVADVQTEKLITAYYYDKNKTNQVEQFKFENRKIISNEVSLEAVTGLQKNIQKAICEKDTTMAKRLLDLGTPYNSKDKTLAIALSTAIRMNNSDYCKLVLDYVKYPNQLAKIYKSSNFRELSEESELYKLLMTKKAEISKENITV